MRRREFIAGLGAAAWPLAAQAQQSSLPVIAYVNGGEPEPSAPYIAAFRKGLSEAGAGRGAQRQRRVHLVSRRLSARGGRHGGPRAPPRGGDRDARIPARRARGQGCDIDDPGGVRRRRRPGEARSRCERARIRAAT